MKEKILEALQQGYKNLGLSKEAFEGVAAFATTIITEEAQIENFVKGAEPMLKAFQSDSDKLRSGYSQQIKELQEKLGTQTPPTDNQGEQGEGKQGEGSEIAKLIQTISESNKANAELLAQMKSELDAFKTEQTSKAAVTLAQSNFNSNDYVKKYSEQAEDAWERALEVYHLGGDKLSAEELTAKAMGYFNKSVSRKGVDTSKPFEGGGEGGDEDSIDVDSIKNALRKYGNLQEPK